MKDIIRILAMLLALLIAGGCEDSDTDTDSSTTTSGDELAENAEQNTSIDANQDYDLTVEVTADSGSTVNIYMGGMPTGAVRVATIEEAFALEDEGMRINWRYSL